MFGQNSLGSGTLADSSSRMFRVEVEGMSQKGNTNQVSYSMRNSGRTFLSVPYNRMNAQLQRINRMGAKVISIKPLTSEGNGDAKMEATAAHQTVNAWDKPKSKETKKHKKSEE